jgi:hypothetical protein
MFYGQSSTDQPIAAAEEEERQRGQRRRRHSFTLQSGFDKKMLLPLVGMDWAGRQAGWQAETSKYTDKQFALFSSLPVTSC